MIKKSWNVLKEVMEMDRKTKLRVLGKLLDAGFDDEKKIMSFGIKDMMASDIRSDEIRVVVELQEATKNHKVISFLADKAKKGFEGGRENG